MMINACISAWNFFFGGRGNVFDDTVHEIGKNTFFNLSFCGEIIDPIANIQK